MQWQGDMHAQLLNDKVIRNDKVICIHNYSTTRWYAYTITQLQGEMQWKLKFHVSVSFLQFVSGLHSTWKTWHTHAMYGC